MSVFTDCYLMRFISLLVASRNAVLCLKRLRAFLFQRLSSSDTLSYNHNSGKASVQVRITPMELTVDESLQRPCKLNPTYKEFATPPFGNLCSNVFQRTMPPSAKKTEH